MLYDHAFFIMESLDPEVGQFRSKTGSDVRLAVAAVTVDRVQGGRLSTNKDLTGNVVLELIHLFLDVVLSDDENDGEKG